MIDLWRIVVPVPQSESPEATGKTRRVAYGFLASFLSVVPILLGLLVGKADHFFAWPLAALIVRFPPITFLLTCLLTGLLVFGLYFGHQAMGAREWLVAGLACAICALLIHFPYHPSDLLYWSYNRVSTVMILIAILSIFPFRLSSMGCPLAAWAMRGFIVYGTYLFFLNRIGWGFCAFFYPWGVVFYEL